MEVAATVLKVLFSVETVLIAIVASAVALYIFACALIEGVTRTLQLLDRLAVDLKERCTHLNGAYQDLKQTVTGQPRRQPSSPTHRPE